jgi:H+-translocating NAD(P) transhydrogenase subunit alpha
MYCDKATRADMKVAVVRETFPGERRVALVPDTLPSLTKAGWGVLVETNAGSAAGFSDAEYEKKGATILSDRAAVFSQADVVLQVRTLGSNPAVGRDDLGFMRRGLVVIGTADPLGNPQAVKELADTGATVFAMDRAWMYFRRWRQSRVIKQC